MTPLRIVVHDFIGHPFQVQLSRQLARNGHQVLHLHFPGFETPKGPLERTPADPSGFSVEGITIAFRHSKYNFIARSAQEWIYCTKCIRRIRAFTPDLVISANATPNIQRALMRSCRQHRVGFVPWVQDFHGVAVGRMVRRKFGALAGGAVGKYFERLDRAVLQASDQVILISPAFLPLARRWPGVVEKSHVIENWAPLPDLPVLPKDNPWSRAQGLADKKVFLYSGTLGLKHNPGLLTALAERFAAEPSVRIVVISQGPGAEWLKRWRQQSCSSNLVLMDYQSFAVFPEALAAADVLIAILNDEAGEICVPSKVLSYCCAQRPVLAAIPPMNPAARLLRDTSGGIVVDPTDTAGFLRGAERFFEDTGFGAFCAANARRYAERSFDIETIADRFESVLRSAVPHGRITGKVGIPAAL